MRMEANRTKRRTQKQRGPVSVMGVKRKLVWNGKETDNGRFDEQERYG